MDFNSRYKYTKTDLLGEGGFSAVYKAHDSLFERYVALKFYDSNAAERYNLISEVRKTVSLVHKNLVQYYDAQVIEVNDRLLGKKSMQVGILEYIDGGDFRQFIKKIPESKIFRNLIIGVLEGLQFLHGKGYIHRDIKPHNILVSKKEPLWEAKLTDFGLSKQIIGQYTASSAMVGTMEYMAPEQIKVEQFGIQGKLSTNVDLWAFGVVLYELFFGLTPFRRSSAQHSKSAVFTNIIFNPLPANINSAPAPYNLILSRCLVKEASKRAQSAHELLEILNKSGDRQSAQSAQPLNGSPSPEKNGLGVSAHSPASGGESFLADLSGVLSARKFNLQNQLFVGRDFNTCQVLYPLMETAVSRKHAVISKDSRNNIYVEDLGSSNGTFVNNRRLHSNEKFLLNKGDLICFGDKRFTLQLTNG